MAAKREEIHVRVSPELKAALVADVIERGSNMTAIAAEILGERFGVPIEPSSIKRAVPGDSLGILLKVPARLERKIYSIASQQRRPKSDVVAEVLCEHYGVEFVPSGSSFRGGRPARLAASA